MKIGAYLRMLRRRQRQRINRRLQKRDANRNDTAQELPLTDLAARYDTTKGRGRAGVPALAAVYEKHLSDVRSTARNVLEIGVEYGGSLQMWADFFPNARIWGVDNDTGTAGFAGDRVSMRIGDQGDAAFMASVVEDSGPLDVVIDDGSHRFEHQRQTLLQLWPHVRPGGVYIVEDIHTSYRPTYGGGLLQAGTFVEFLKGVLDDLHVKEHKSEVSLSDVESVHVQFQTAILRKKAKPLEEPKA